MTIELGSRTFFEQHFGEHSSGVESALAAAGQEAHGLALDAKIASELKSNQPYGSSFWLLLPQKVATRLANVLPGARLFTPKSSQYDLVLWNGTLIFPVKVMDGASARSDSMRVRRSEFRQKLFALNPMADEQPSLLDIIDEGLEEEGDLTAERLADMARRALGSSAESMIVVACVCSAEGGVQSMFAGPASLDEKGFIVWSEPHPHRIPIAGPVAVRSVPNAVTSERFDGAPRPRVTLAPVVDDPTGTTNGDAVKQGADDRPRLSVIKDGDHATAGPTTDGPVGAISGSTADDPTPS